MCKLSYHYFCLGNHSNFCQLWMCHLRKFLLGLFVSGQSSLHPIHSNAAICFLPQAQLSVVDFLSSKRHQQAAPNAKWCHCSSPLHTLKDLQNSQQVLILLLKRYLWPGIYFINAGWPELNWLHVKFSCPFFPSCQYVIADSLIHSLIY